MSLSPKLQLRQTQSLVMTPQLLQSIRLLQLTHTELEQFIASEIESNPLLERDERGDREAEMELEGTGGEYDALPYSAASMAERLDSSLENPFPDDPGVQETIGPDLSAQWRSAAGNGIAAAGNDDFNLEAVAAAPVTLREHLREQIAFAFHDPASRILAEALTEELDEAGYLAADLDEIALRAGADRAMLDRVLETCRTLDPPGLFAR